MPNDACDLCLCEVELGETVIYNVVPHEVAVKAGLPASKAVKLCARCCREVEAWYLKRVSDITYDWGSKQFVPKTPSDMVKEYEAAYAAFVRYKQSLRVPR